MSKKIQVTKEGFTELNKELKELLETKRPKAVDRLAYARSQGDLSENSDYHSARDDLEFLDGRIAELQNVLKNAVVVKNNNKSGVVSVGAMVEVKANGSQYTFNIVGEWEADPTKKKISHTSPLGQALVGKKVGDKVEVQAPAGKLHYEILKIG